MCFWWLPSSLNSFAPSFKPHDWDRLWERLIISDTVFRCAFLSTIILLIHRLIWGPVLGLHIISELPLDTMFGGFSPEWLRIRNPMLSLQTNLMPQCSYPYALNSEWTSKRFFSRYTFLHSFLRLIHSFGSPPEWLRIWQRMDSRETNEAVMTPPLCPTKECSFS